MTKSFFEANDSSLTLSDSNVTVYGSNGVQTLKIKAGVNNIKADANVEKAGGFSAFDGKQAVSNILIVRMNPARQRNLATPIVFGCEAEQFPNAFTDGQNCWPGSD